MVACNIIQAQQKASRPSDDADTTIVQGHYSDMKNIGFDVQPAQHVTSALPKLSMKFFSMSSPLTVEIALVTCCAG